MIRRNEELSKYLTKARGITRTTLNVLAFIGLLTFGVLLFWVVFDRLGKKWYGEGYLILFIFGTVGAVRLDSLPLLMLATSTYIAAWIHANIILSRYEPTAKQRIAELGQQGDLNTNKLLEEGLLLHKVLRKTEQSLEVFDRALQLEGGDPFLWNLSGVTLVRSKQYNTATKAFDRAAASATDKALIKQIQRNRAFVENRLK